MFSKFEAAWNKHDPKAIMALWAEDGDMISKDGSRLAGKSKLWMVTTETTMDLPRSSKWKVVVESIEWMTSEVAVVEIQIDISTSPEKTVKSGRQSDVLVHGADGWKIKAARAIYPGKASR